MKISTSTSVTGALFGIEKAIPKIAAAGFDAVDLSLFKLMKEPDNPLNGDNYREYAGRLRGIADGCGVRVNQTHAPFPPYNFPYTAYDAAIPVFVRAIEITAILGAGAVVIHPVVCPAAALAENVRFYEGLVPYLKKFKVKAAIENVYGHDPATGKMVPAFCGRPAELAALLDALDSEYFTACLDVGHANFRDFGTTPAEMVHALGPHLGALHISDNDGEHDLHTLPMTQALNWDALMKALKAVGYRGDFTLEADQFLKKFQPEFFDTVLKFMYDTARYFLEKYGL